jgi:hypothetical protein
MATELPPITVEAPPVGPGVSGSDTDVSFPVPRTPPTASSITGTPGTGGSITFGTYHGQPIPEPHRVYKFDVRLPTVDNYFEALPIVQSISPGFDNTGFDQHPIGGRHHFTAHFFQVTNLQLLFYDDEVHTPIEYIYAWKKMIRNYDQNTGMDDGTYKYPEGTNGYLRDINVFLLNMQNEKKYNIIYSKCFPTEMAPLRLDYEPSARTVISQTFAVNRIITKKVVGSQSSTATPSAITPAGAAINPLNVQALRL